MRQKPLADHVVAVISPDLFSADGRRQPVFLCVPGGFRQDLEFATGQGDSAIPVPSQTEVSGPKVVSTAELTGEKDLCELGRARGFLHQKLRDRESEHAS